MTVSPQRSDNCLACNAPFPANRELAAVPAARRVAFDPALGRVWRICTRCGHWNLLGARASAAAIAELRSRLPVAAGPQIAHDTIGRVEVLTVSTDEKAHAGGIEGIQTRRLLRWLGRFKYLLPFLAFAPILGGVAYAFLKNPSSIHLDSWQFLASLALGFWFAREGANWRLHRRVHGWAVALGVLATAFLALVVPRFAADPWFGPWLTLLIVLVPIPGEFLFIGLYWRRSVTLPDGEALRLSKVALRDAAIGSEENERGIAVHDIGHGASVSGMDAINALQTLGEFDVGSHSREDVELGWLLLRRHGTVAALVHALDEVRPEENGRHLWRELPLPWRIALHFGAVEAAGSPAERDALRRKIRKSSEVAAIAESLDQEQ